MILFALVAGTGPVRILFQTISEAKRRFPIFPILLGFGVGVFSMGSLRRNADFAFFPIPLGLRTGLFVRKP